MSTEKAQIIQRLAFSEFISKYSPSEDIQAAETNPIVNVQLGKYEGLEDKTELNARFFLICCLIKPIIHCHVLLIFRCNLTKDRQDRKSVV